ncbi:MAG: hypothetical protein LC667_02185 [Thioalkalivibrio sp.]|nr:hypothetical protein [Thioalkalivibrio sp.]
MKAKSMMEDLEASFDKLSAEPEPEQEPTAGLDDQEEEEHVDAEGTEDHEEAADDTDTSAESEGGAEGDEGDESEVPESADDGSVEGEGEDGAEGAGTEDEGDTGRAPVSWTPEVREHWEKLPKEVKAEVARREKEITEMMGQTTGARRFAQEWTEMVRPYEPLMAAQGANPYTGVKRLLEIGAGLSLGNKEQKADIISNLIKQYQIDVETLDGMLSGQHQPDPMQQIGSLIDERLAPIQQRYSQEEQYRQQQSQQAVKSELEQFKQKNQFYDDVRMDMADIMEIAGKRGEQLNLQEAYDRACAMNPKVSKVVQQRRAAESAAKRKKESEAKRRASSSVRPSAGAGGAAPADPDNLTDALSAAWDKNVPSRQGRV